MKEMMDAAKQINKILHECEENGDNVDTTLGKISAVKVHGVVFPTLMLMEIIDKFVDGYKDRQKKMADIDLQADEIQNKYENYSRKWNAKDLN